MCFTSNTDTTIVAIERGSDFKITKKLFRIVMYVIIYYKNFVVNKKPYGSN